MTTGAAEVTLSPQLPSHESILPRNHGAATTIDGTSKPESPLEVSCCWRWVCLTFDGWASFLSVGGMILVCPCSDTPVIIWEGKVWESIIFVWFTFSWSVLNLLFIGCLVWNSYPFVGGRLNPFSRGWIRIWGWRPVSTDGHHGDAKNQMGKDGQITQTTNHVWAHLYLSPKNICSKLSKPPKKKSWGNLPRSSIC